MKIILCLGVTKYEELYKGLQHWEGWELQLLTAVESTWEQYKIQWFFLKEQRLNNLLGKEGFTNSTLPLFHICVLCISITPSRISFSHSPIMFLSHLQVLFLPFIGSLLSLGHIPWWNGDPNSSEFKISVANALSRRKHFTAFHLH